MDSTATVSEHAARLNLSVPYVRALITVFSLPIVAKRASTTGRGRSANLYSRTDMARALEMVGKF